MIEKRKVSDLKPCMKIRFRGHYFTTGASMKNGTIIYNDSNGKLALISNNEEVDVLIHGTWYEAEKKEA